MATFTVSDFGFGRRYLTSEPEEIQQSTIRLFFVGFTAVFCSFFILLIIYRFCSKHSQVQSSSGITRLWILHLTSYIIHSLHYVDNIYRPVAYAEPQWLYEKYLISTMEITFFFNIPLTIVGYLTLNSLMDSLHDCEWGRVQSNCKRMTFYIIGSLLTLGHYLTKPPTFYEPFLNFTIGGEGIATIIYAFCLYQTYQFSGGMMGKSSRGTEVYLHESLLDHEEETKMENKKIRRRSKTPTFT